jgi:ATP-dependent Lon protease
LRISAKRARELLGKRRFFSETRRRTKDPGVATGLAWTPVGGEVLFVEATAVPGSGKLTITGQLGEVMRESAQAALSWVRAHAKDVNPELPDDWFAEHDLHVHVPAGAVPKDGPSAGVAMATALASLISNRAVRNDVAMTGEITLTGQVLPIGGLKEKSLAAQRAGIKQVIVPDRNEGDVEEISEEERRGLEFIYADDIGDALKTALEPDGKRPRSASKSAGKAPSG